MRLVTWNACRGQFSKKIPYLDHLHPDIAFVQEIARPKEPISNVFWVGSNPNQGMAVIAHPPYSITPLPMPEGVPDYIVPIAVEGPRSFVALAVCTMGDKPYPYVRAACRAIEIYNDLFLNHEVVMLGDFNSNAIWDKDHPAALNHSSMVKRLADHGLVSAYHAFCNEVHGEETQHTFYYHWKQERKFHIDYCFIPQAWIAHLRHVDVGSFAAWQKCSDHRPILVELALENSDFGS